MKKTLKISLAAASVLLALSALAGCTSTKKSSDSSSKIPITLATDGATRPFTYTVNNQLTGYDVEVARAVFAKLPQYKVTYTQTDFNAVLAGINDGRFNVVANDVSWTAAREPLYYFSSPLSLSNDAIAVKSGDYKTLSDLAGKSTEGLASSNYSALISNYNKAHASQAIKLNYVDANDPMASRLSDVESGKIDFVLYDAISLQNIIKEQGLNLKVVKISDHVGDPVHDGYEYLIFNKDAQGKTLQTRVNAVLKQLQADGTLKALSEKYLGGDFVPAADQYK